MRPQDQARWLPLVAALTQALLASTAHAFDPNEGAEPLPMRPLNQPYAWHANRTHLSRDVVPERYHIAPRAAISAPATPTYQAPVPPRVPAAAAGNIIAYTPAKVMPERAIATPARATPVFDPAAGIAAPAPATAPRFAPMENPVASVAPVAPPTPIPSYVAITPAPMAMEPYVPPSEEQPTRSSTRRTRYTVGVEGFYDNYQEPEQFPDLENESIYGGITAGFEHDFVSTGNSHPYIAGDLRVSYGSEDYSSSSGTIENIPQWEFEGRFLYGQNFLLGGARAFKLYSGLGTRYYRDESKGEVTNLGAFGYDRRILQFYAPVGITYEFQAGGYRFAPNLELDTLLYGSVSSRLGTVPGFSNARNDQNFASGYGLRAEFAISRLNADGRGWQFSPFIRYWDIDDSEPDDILFNGVPGVGLEPQNERYQVGAKLKYLF